MKSIFHGRRRILVNYLTSYISIALLSCVLVGALLTWYSANNLQGQLQQEINEKARNVLDDLDNQIQHMSAIADTIAVEDRYKPAIFRHNNYQEMEMLESFTQYRYVSSISDSYFLLYRDKDRVYRSDGEPLASLRCIARSLPERMRRKCGTRCAGRSLLTSIRRRSIQTAFYLRSRSK